MNEKQLLNSVFAMYISMSHALEMTINFYYPTLKPAAHESYQLSKKLLVPVSSADSSPCAGTFY